VDGYWGRRRRGGLLTKQLGVDETLTVTDQAGGLAGAAPKFGQQGHAEARQRWLRVQAISRPSNGLPEPRSVSTHTEPRSGIAILAVKTRPTANNRPATRTSRLMTAETSSPKMESQGKSIRAQNRPLRLVALGLTCARTVQNSHGRRLRPEATMMLSPCTHGGWSMTTALPEHVVKLPRTRSGKSANLTPGNSQ